MNVCKKQGHPLTPENTITNKKTGKRRCRQCDDEYKRNRVMPKCTIDDCRYPQKARKLCRRHYGNLMEYGDPFGPPVAPREDLEGDEWRPIPEWEGLYEVSSAGRVWSVRNRLLLTLTVGYFGYLEVALCWLRTRPEGTQQNLPVHRLVARAFIGPRPEGAVIRHLDGDKHNNSAANLCYGTQAENIEDEFRHGTHVNLRFMGREACKNGHDYEPGSFYTNKAGAKVCRACDREKIARYRAKRKAGREAAD